MKYKKLFNNESIEEDTFDPDYNVSQADVYQMVSYAVASGISDIALIYPALPLQKQNIDFPIFEIEDSFTNGTIIRVHIFIVDIIHEDELQMKISDKLEKIFYFTNQRLILQLQNAIKRIHTIS